MEIQHPFRVVTSAVDGDVLGVLSGADDWFTVQAVSALVDHRSVEGVRLALRRLAEQGIVSTQAAGRASLYRLNRDHLIAEAVIEIASLGERLQRRMSDRLNSFTSPPRYAFLFGSAARGSMRTDSDIDVALIRDDRADETWDTDVTDFTTLVHSWTGNDPQIVEYRHADILNGMDAEGLLRSIANEGIALRGDRADFRKDLLRR